MLADGSSILPASTKLWSVHDHLRPPKPLLYGGLGVFLLNLQLVIVSQFWAWFRHKSVTFLFLSCRKRRQEPKQGQEVRLTKFSIFSTPRKTPKFGNFLPLLNIKAAQRQRAVCAAGSLVSMISLNINPYTGLLIIFYTQALRRPQAESAERTGRIEAWIYTYWFLVRVYITSELTPDVRIYRFAGLTCITPQKSHR